MAIKALADQVEEDVELYVLEMSVSSVAVHNYLEEQSRYEEQRETPTT